MVVFGYSLISCSLIGSHYVGDGGEGESGDARQKHRVGKKSCRI